MKRESCKHWLLALALLIVAYFADGFAAARAPHDSYVFAYFKDNGEDGLHLATSRDGLNWQALSGDRSFLKPEVGKDKLMRDPHLSVGPDGVYHLVWTSSWSEPVIGHATSRDLMHWSAQQAIAPMSNEPDARNVWAPEAFYDAARREFIIYWSTTIPGRFPATEASADNGRNHRIYATTTRDFQSFTPARLFYDGGFNVIDATIARAGKQYVMVIKDETLHPVAQKNLRVATAARAAGPYAAASPPITGDYWAEGPTALKVGRRWIVYFDKYRDHRYGAVATTDWQHWEDISEQVHFPLGARHGTALRVPPARLQDLIEQRHN